MPNFWDPQRCAVICGEILQQAHTGRPYYAFTCWVLRRDTISLTTRWRPLIWHLQKLITGNFSKDVIWLELTIIPDPILNRPYFLVQFFISEMINSLAIISGVCTKVWLLRTLKHSSIKKSLMSDKMMCSANSSMRFSSKYNGYEHSHFPHCPPFFHPPLLRMAKPKTNYSKLSFKWLINGWKGNNNVFIMIAGLGCKDLSVSTHRGGNLCNAPRH